MASVIIFQAGFTEDGVALTNVTLAGANAPTVSVRAFPRNGDAASTVTSGAATSYDTVTKTWRYRATSLDTEANQYIALFTTAYADADQRDVWGLGEVFAGEYGKAGYSLAATGLDAIATTAPGGVASTFTQMVVQLWRHFFKKSTMTSTHLKTYADDDETVITTQAVSDDGTTQTRGSAV